MSVLFVVIGATGNQGGSVATRFAKDPRYRVRGVTRNPEGAKARALEAQGVEIVQADLDDVKSLIQAFKGASLIFSVTNYWEPFFRPDCREDAQEKGIDIRKYTYDVELRQGKNIADAAATTVDTLLPNGFLVSTLSHAGKCSDGRMTDVYHFDSKADVFPYYVTDRYPQLAAKMSCIQTGYFTSSYKLAPDAYLGKQSDGSFQMSFVTDSSKPVPHLAVNEDMGEFVHAVAQMPPGKNYMAAGSICSWTEFMRLWSEITGKKGVYKQVSAREMEESGPDAAFGKEITVMFEYSSNPGYDGGMDLLGPDDLRAAGIECNMTSLEQWMRAEDWNSVIY